MEAVEESMSEAKSYHLDNKLKSALFVQKIANKIYDECISAYGTKNLKLNVQEVNLEEKRKEPGEWLLDATITLTDKIKDDQIRLSESTINYQIVWAIESEYSTRMNHFADDFGKLLCVKAKNYFYLHGLNQDRKSVTEFIERRIKTIKQFFVNRMIFDSNFFIGFWPSPEKKGNMSFWDSNPNLNKYVRLYKIGPNIEEIQ